MIAGSIWPVRPAIGEWPLAAQPFRIGTEQECALGVGFDPLTGPSANARSFSTAVVHCVVFARQESPPRSPATLLFRIKRVEPIPQGAVRFVAGVKKFGVAQVTVAPRRIGEDFVGE